MELSILKFLEEEEEEDKDESILSKDDVDAFQASLIREIEGGNNSSSQQFAIQDNGIEDANTNNLHILESTQMKEQQQSVLVIQDQELKPEHESHLQHSPPHDHRQPGQLCENPSHVPQASNLHSRNNSISTEPERPQPQYLKLQNMSSQRTHGVEQHVGSVNHHDPTKLQVREFVRIVVPQVDNDRGKQLLNLYDKCERKQITKYRFIREVRDILGDQMTRLVVSQLEQENKGITGQNHYRESFTSAGSNVRTTPKMSSVGQKKPLEAQGSSLPPSSKKQKLCGTALSRSDKQFNDITALSGIDLMEEERELLSSRSEKDSRVLKSFGRVAQEEEGRTILQKVPLQRKLAEIMAKSGLKHINDDVERCLSLCVEERMRGLLSSIIRMSKQRTDPEKCRNRICITSDIRKQINEMNQKAKEEWERKHGGEEKLKNEENDTAKEDNRSEQVKANKKEQDEKRTKAANAAALASVGGENAFLKWKLMAEARQEPSSGTGRNSKKPSGGRKFGKKQGSPKVVRSISVKDVISVVEKEPQMSRSTLLYRLYNRIFSDVPTKT